MQEVTEEAKVRARLRRAHELTNESPSAIWLVQAIIEDAVLHAASDVHIDPLPETLCIRLRIDGELTNTYSLPRVFHEELVARCKILAGLRIDERSSGQDGRFGFESHHAGHVDVRISLLPCYFGQNVVLRLLLRTRHHASLEELGMTPEQASTVTKQLHVRQGLILISGPTGSGKTTTLYALMRILQERPLSLVSVEDPVEYVMDSVRQIEVRVREGFSFGSALRSVLRQDPDVLMVGEIRDAETARLALQASLTGHLVLATIHGNSGTGTLIRLKDLGIESYLIAETFSLVISQQLVKNSDVPGRHAEFKLLEYSQNLSRAIRSGSLTEHSYE